MTNYITTIDKDLPGQLVDHLVCNQQVASNIMDRLDELLQKISSSRKVVKKKEDDAD